jgi:SP family myo-inositol transporter-like MFS transporter 13
MLVVMGTDLGSALTDWEKVGIVVNSSLTSKEAITSATTFGALLGGLAAGALSDYTGRKPVLALSNVVFIHGAILQAVSKSPAG